MPEQSTPRITTQGEAVERLIEWQREEGATHPSQPAWADTIETEMGWAFFNVNGYMGTVTPDGEVVIEEQFSEGGDE